MSPLVPTGFAVVVLGLTLLAHRLIRLRIDDGRVQLAFRVCFAGLVLAALGMTLS